MPERNSFATGLMGGRLSRREFLSRLGAMGVTSTAALALFEACSNSTAAQGGVSTASRTLIVAVSSDLTSLDWNIFGNFPRETETEVNVMGRLVDYAVHNGIADPFHSRPMLASLHESADGLVLTFRLLRPGMKQYPGDVITASDFLYYLQRSQGTNQSFSLWEASHVSTSTDVLQGFEVVDTNTFRITATGWSPILHSLINQGLIAMDARQYKAHASPDDPWATGWAKAHSSYSGPYYVAQHVPGEQIVLLSNPYWKLTAPFFTKIIFRVLPASSDRVLLLKAGEVDIAQDLSPQEINDLSTAPGVKVISSRSGDMAGLLMNVTKPPFTNLDVRKAVSWMVPYKAIIDDVYHGRALPSPGPCPSAIVRGGDDSYWPYASAPDPEQAKRHLVAAGLPNGFSFPLAYDVGHAEFEQMATLIQGSLAQVGIKAVLNPMPEAAFQQSKYQASLPAFLDSLLPWIPDAVYYIALLWQGGSIGARYIGYDNPDVDKLVTQASGTEDNTARNSVLSHAIKLIVDDAPWAWICMRNFNAAMRKRIQGYVHYPDSRYRYYELSSR